MYTYFILFFRVLHFYIYKGSYSNIDFKTRGKRKHADQYMTNSLVMLSSGHRANGNKVVQ